MRKRRVNPSVYTESYYKHCSSVIDKRGRIDKRFEKLFEFLDVDFNKKILD